MWFEGIRIYVAHMYICTYELAGFVGFNLISLQMCFLWGRLETNFIIDFIEFEEHS